jgi:hypothetical protein
MPWWGWALLVVLAAVAVPIKLRILKKMLAKRNKDDAEDSHSLQVGDECRLLPEHMFHYLPFCGIIKVV